MIAGRDRRPGRPGPGPARAVLGVVVLPVLVAMLLATGCTPTSTPDVQAAAQRFQGALRSGDTDRACSQLSDEVRSSLELTTTRPCPAALDALQLSSDQPVAVQVWGDNAQARLPNGVLFLAEFPTGWKITGAGCRARPERPYACALRA